MFIELLKILLALLLILVLSRLYIFNSNYWKRNCNHNLFYSALAVKLIFSLFFSFVYKEYYAGGDTLHYHKDASLLATYFWNDTISFFNLWLFDDSWKIPLDSFSFIGKETSESILHTVKLTVPIEVISLGSFYATSLWVSFISFFALWKLHGFLVKRFKIHSKAFNFLLFFPSILFWTAGILKDAYVFAAICLLIYCVGSSVEILKVKWKYLIVSIFSAFIIVLLKPYIMLALIPSISIWICLELLKKRTFRLIRGPIFLLFTCLAVIFLFKLFQSDLGVYGRIENLIAHSTKLKEGFILLDQERSYNEVSKLSNQYNDNVFKVIFSVVYQPLLWQSWNIFSFMAATENTVLLILTSTVFIALLFDLKLIKLFVQYPFLCFCLIFSLLLSYGIGMSVGNFGAIVRFKTAFIVFYYIPILFLGVKLKERWYDLINN